MKLNEKIAEVYIGHIKGRNYGNFKDLGTYVVAVMLDGKKIFNSQTTAIESGLRDRASDIRGHLRRNKITHYNLINGRRIEDNGVRTNNGTVVECNSVTKETEKFLKKSLDSLLQEWLFSKFYEELWSIAHPRKFKPFYQ